MKPMMNFIGRNLSNAYYTRTRNYQTDRHLGIGDADQHEIGNQNHSHRQEVLLEDVEDPLLPVEAEEVDPNHLLLHLHHQEEMQTIIIRKETTFLRT